jgi:hypothetical protein
VTTAIVPELHHLSSGRATGSETEDLGGEDVDVPIAWSRGASEEEEEEEERPGGRGRERRVRPLERARRRWGRIREW